MKTVNYKEIIKLIKESDNIKEQNKYKILKNITEEDIDEMVNIIIERKYIYEHSKRNLYYISLMFDNVLPLIFSDEEIKQYFKCLIKNNQSNEDTWTVLSKEDIFNKITNKKYYLVKKKIKYLQKIYIQAFNELSIVELHPLLFKEKIINKIKNNKDLKEVCAEFNEKYSSSCCHDLMSYLNALILLEIGEERFSEYINAMIEEYISTLEEINIQTVNTYSLLNYIFGIKIRIVGRINTRKSEDKKKDCCVYFLLLKEFLPYTIGCYGYKKDRETLYSLLEFDDNKVKEYEEKYQNIDIGLYVRSGYASQIYNPEELDINGYRVQDLYKYLDDYIKKFRISNRIFPYYKDVIKAIIDKHKNDKNLSLAFRKLSSNKPCNTLMYNYYENKAKETKEYWFLKNSNEIKSNKDTLILYYKNDNGYSYKKIDLSKIPYYQIRNQLLSFLNFYSYDTIAILTDSPKLVSFISYVVQKYEIYTIEDIEEWHVLSFLNKLDIVDKVNPATIRAYLTSIKRFFQHFLIHSSILKENVAANIFLSHLKDHQIPTATIPDDVLLFLDNNIKNMKRKDFSLMYRLLSETGWRWGDIKRLETNNISKKSIEPNFATIKISTSKTKGSRIKNNLGDVIEDNISMKLYNDLCDYIEETQHLRNIYDTEIIFFFVRDNTVKYNSSREFNKWINNFLQENGIVSIDETYLDFSSKQTRKTVASNLISAGAPTAAIQKKLGHVTKRTTEEYYAHVNKKKLAELNHEFYKERFDVYLDEEKLKLFTEEERRILYVDFCLGNRTTELGVCSKHPSEGRCVNLGQKSCATCPKLCTGKKYLEQWEKLAEDSLNLLIEFKNKYEELEIPEEEYNEYVEYKQEKKLYEQYISVVNAIKGGN